MLLGGVPSFNGREGAVGVSRLMLSSASAFVPAGGKVVQITSNLEFPELIDQIAGVESRGIGRRIEGELAPSHRREKVTDGLAHCQAKRPQLRDQSLLHLRRFEVSRDPAPAA
jgi:hypothetical protein